MRNTNIANLFRSIPTGDSMLAYNIGEGLDSESPDSDYARDAFEWLDSFLDNLKGDLHSEAWTEMNRLSNFVDFDDLDLILNGSD